MKNTINGQEANRGAACNVDYKELYDRVEGSYSTIKEVQEAEKALEPILEDIRSRDKALWARLDSAIGRIARAYEKNGFYECTETLKTLCPIAKTEKNP